LTPPVDSFFSRVNLLNFGVNSGRQEASWKNGDMRKKMNRRGSALALDQDPTAEIDRLKKIKKSDT
jgi:hypothetical protein